MKLEAGKKYKLRNGVIAECLAVWSREYYGFQASVAISAENDPSRYTIDGRFMRNKIEHSLDIVAEYRESKKFDAWVNLYSDGTAEIFTDPMTSLTEQRPGIFEHRRITWEVPDNG